MDRRRARELLEELLRRVDAGRTDWPLNLIREVYVFGSFSRGATEVHDVDVAVEFDHTDLNWANDAVSAMMSGRDWYGPLRRVLGGSRRGIQFLFNAREKADFDMTRLWTAGDPFEEALNRLNSIHVDDSAGRSPRHAMLPIFEGLDNWLIRPYREARVASVSRHVQ